MSSDAPVTTFPPPPGPAGSTTSRRPAASRPARARREVPTAGTRVLLASMAAGAFLAVAVAAEQIGLATSLLVVVVVVALLWSGAVTNRSARWLLASSLLIAPWLTLRTNVATTTVNGIGIIVLMLIAVSSGTNGRPFGTGASPVWPHHLANLGRPALEVWQFVGGGLRPAITESKAGRARMRGLVWAFPGLALCTMLLASADASFASLFDAVGMGWANHLVIAAVGFVVVAAGCLAAGTALPEAGRPTRRTRDAQEATAVVACYATLYGMFVVSRFLHPPVTQTAPELSDAARAGFFQLVAVACITLVVLVRIRGRTTPSGVLRSLIITVCGLTLVVVGVALHRLGRYRQRFGLTELRLSTTWISWWLGVLFVLLAISTVLRLGRGRWMAVVVASVVMWLVAWNVTNTDARIAAANLGRVPLAAESTGRDRYDGELTVLLSDDAVPTIVDGFEGIPLDQQAEIREWICAGPRTAPGGLSWNAAASAAAAARRSFCP